MSMWNRPAAKDELGEAVASMADYEAAQKCVSHLIANEVPARDITIVGTGVRTIERVTGRLGYATAARSGAMNGVLIGLILSAVMVFGNPEAPITLLLGFLLIGVALGMIMSLVMYAIVRRRRDFASVTQVSAESYEVRVKQASLAVARRQIAVRDLIRPPRPQPTVDLSEPPRYGERIPPTGGAQPGQTVPPAQPVQPVQQPPAQPVPQPPVPPLPAPPVPDSPAEQPVPEQPVPEQPPAPSDAPEGERPDADADR